VDIWLAAVLVAWLPVAAALALLVGRSIAASDRRERATTRHPRVGDALAAVPRQAARRPRAHRTHHLAS